MSKPSDLLTVPMAAKAKNVHVKSVYRAIRNGRIVVERQEKTILIRRRELDKWRAERGPEKSAGE